MLNGSSNSGPLESLGFRTTQWSLVFSAGRTDDQESRDALEKLCQNYWGPLYVFVRRQGYDLHAAQDLTQEFFARLLHKNSFLSADPAKGRFRSFLLASMKNFLANEWDRTTRKKRGGGCTTFSLDADSVERELLLDSAHSLDPERHFDQSWAKTVVDRVLAQLRREYSGGQRSLPYDSVLPFLLLECDPPSYLQLSQESGMTEAGVRTAVFRLRQRFRELFRNEIAHTVANPEEIDGEIRYLFSVLQS